MMLVQRGVLDVDAIHDVLDLEYVAHGWHVTGDGAVAERHEDLGMSTDLVDHLEIVLAADGTFDERYIDPLWEFLGIDERTVNDFDMLGERDEAFVYIEERHVAAGAAVEPNGGEFHFAH